MDGGLEGGGLGRGDGGRLEDPPTQPRSAREREGPAVFSSHCRPLPASYSHVRLTHFSSKLKYLRGAILDNIVDIQLFAKQMSANSMEHGTFLSKNIY